MSSPKLIPHTELEGIDWHDLAGDDPIDEVTDRGESLLEGWAAPRISPRRSRANRPVGDGRSARAAYTQKPASAAVGIEDPINR
jgi:hypothetical protein